MAPIAAADPMASQPRVWRDGRLRTSRTVSPKRSRQTLGDRPFKAVRVRNDSVVRCAGGLSAAGGTIDGAVTRTVRDAAAILDVISAPMPGEPYYAPNLDRPLRD